MIRTRRGTLAFIGDDHYFRKHFCHCEYYEVQIAHEMDGSLKVVLELK